MQNKLSLFIFLILVSAVLMTGCSSTQKPSEIVTPTNTLKDISSISTTLITPNETGSPIISTQVETKISATVPIIKPNEEYQVLINQEGGYEIKYPRDWTIKYDNWTDKNNKNVYSRIVTFVSPDKNTEISSSYGSFIPNYRSNAEWLNEDLEIGKRYFNDFIVTRQGKTTILSKDASYFEFTFTTNEGFLKKAMIIGLAEEDNIYKLDIFSTPENYNNMTTIFETMRLSYKPIYSK